MRTLSTTLLLGTLAAPLAAQGPVSLVQEGDVIPGVGTVIDVELVTLVQGGDWIVEVETDNPDPDMNHVALRAGNVILRDGDPVSAPLGATIKTLDAYALNGQGHLVNNVVLGGAVGANDFEGVYYDGALVIQRGDLATATGFPPGTTWGNFADVQLNDARRVLVRGWGDDPTVAGTTDFFAAVLDLDANGAVIGGSVLAKEGDVPPGQTETINTIRTGAWSGRLASTGDAFWACDLNGPSTSDGCVYRTFGGIPILMAQEGSPSPVPGRNWGSLLSPEIDVNSAGDWTLKDNLDGSPSDDGIIVLNGAKFVQEGDGHPDIAPFVFNELGNGPAKLDENGSVLWFGGWNDTTPLAYREAFFVDQTMIVREGQTTVGGVLLEDIDQQNDSYTMSRDGKLVIFIGTLTGGVEGAFLLSLEEVTPYCTAKINSAGCAPTLAWSGTPSASAGSGFVLQALSELNQQVGIFFYGTSGATSVAFQGGFLCVQPPTTRVLPAQASGGSGAGSDCSGSYSLDFNAYVAQGLDPNLVAGAQVNGQFWSRETGFAPPDATNLSGGLQFVLQP